MGKFIEIGVGDCVDQDSITRIKNDAAGCLRIWYVGGNPDGHVVAGEFCADLLSLPKRLEQERTVDAGRVMQERMYAKLPGFSGRR